MKIIKEVLKIFVMICGGFVIFSLIVLPVVWFLHMATSNLNYIIGFMLYVVLLVSIVIAAQERV